MSDAAATNTTLTPGVKLRLARETRGLALTDIAAMLRIKPQFLEALEADQPEGLPSVAHARGFLRSYAAYLGLDLEDRATAPLPTILPLAVNTSRPLASRWAGLLPPLLVIGGIVLLYMLWQWLQPPPPAPIAPPPKAWVAAKPVVMSVPTVASPAPESASPEPQIPPKAQAVKPTPPQADSTAPSSIPAKPPAATAATATAADPVTLRALSDSWVQITDAKGVQLYSRLMRAGETYRVPLQPGLRLSTGNAGGLSILRDGKAGAPLGTHAQVIRNMPLAAGEKAAPEKAQTKPKPVAEPTGDDDLPLDGEE